MPIHFYDSANPESIPSGVYAAVYINGAYRWPESEMDRMRRIFRISVEREASWARIARCLDIENGAGEPQDAVPFCKARLDYGFNDATVYVNRSNEGDVRERLTQAQVHAFFWVATLDGTQNIPGAWAVQYQGGLHAAYDLSVLHGVNNFVLPQVAVPSFQETPQGAYVIRAWAWLQWAYTRAIPVQIQVLRDAQRRDIRG